MPTDDSPITRRRLLESATTVGLAGLVSGVGTWSYLSDSEEGIGTITAGTMDLEVDGDDAAQQFTIADATPGDSGTETIHIWNDGSLPGELSLTLHLLECKNDDQDNAEDRPCEWDPDQDNSENQNGGKGKDRSKGKHKNEANSEKDLAANLQVEIGFARDGAVDGGDTTTVVPNQPVSEISFPSVHDSTHQLLPKGQEKNSSYLFLAWNIDEDAPEVEGDTLGFGITVNLE